MCQDHAQPTRRQVLYGAGTLAAAAAAARLPRPARPQALRPRRLPPRATGRENAFFQNQLAYSMAMHIHSSFSEQTGSMESQFFQADSNGVDVLWLTDHDHRMDGSNYRDTVHFTSLTESGGTGQGGAWAWTPQQSGPVSAGSAGGIVTSPSSPHDTVAGGALSLAVQSTGGGPATLGFYADSQAAGYNYRDNLTGQTLTIDVLLQPGWANGYLELLIDSSYHLASAGRPAGSYSLSYQVVPDTGQPSSRAAQGNLGVITLPVPADGATWTTLTITPSDDIAALWPDLDYRDFALWELFLNAVSTGDLVAGFFDYLTFDRTISGGEFFSQQADMMSQLSGAYPDVTALQGLEVSLFLPHINWFGSSITLPSYGTIHTTPPYDALLASTVIPDIHAAGGLASYNHPFGFSDVAALPAATQDSMLAQLATQLLGNNALNCDILEFGYNLRQGVDLAHHLSLWNIMSRNAVFLTGNGASDDHFGLDWAGITNNWITSAWAASPQIPDLTAALAAGRAWTGSLAAFGPGSSLDLVADRCCPMGSASVSSLAQRQLTVCATGVPAGGSVQVVQGGVDYAGAASPADNTQVIASYADTDLAGAGGFATVAADTSSESFALLTVTDANGSTVAVSNPVWLLHNTPPNGIPAARQV